MAHKGNLLSFRPDIKVLDATIRDGGLVNDFFFQDEFVRNLYRANVKAGVDYMEFGYRADKEMFDTGKFGSSPSSFTCNYFIIIVSFLNNERLYYSKLLN